MILHRELSALLSSWARGWGEDPESTRACSEGGEAHSLMAPQASCGGACRACS